MKYNPTQQSFVAQFNYNCLFVASKNRVFVYALVPFVEAQYSESNFETMNNFSFVGDLYRYAMFLSYLYLFIIYLYI
jgi:hypothetical protein